MIANPQPRRTLARTAFAPARSGVEDSLRPEGKWVRVVGAFVSVAVAAAAGAWFGTACGGSPPDDPVVSESSAAADRGAGGSEAGEAAGEATAESPGEAFVDPVTRRRADDGGAGKLVAAAAEDDPRRVRELLAEGVPANARDAHGYGALHQAAAANATEVLGVLLQAGAEVDAADGRGWSPLTWAAYLGSYAAARELLDAGADPNHSAPPESVTALDQLLMAWHMARGSAPRMPPLREEQRFAIARLLLEGGADPNRSRGIPPLELALFSGRTDLVALFLDHGADLDALPDPRLRQSFRERPDAIGELLREREAAEPGPPR